MTAGPRGGQAGGFTDPEWAFTMFSLTTELLRAERSPDELLRSAVEAGLCTAIEADAPQHFRGYPWAGGQPDAQALAERCEFRALAEALGIRLTLLGIYNDSALRRDRVMTPQESVDYIDGQLAAASAMGFEGARIAFGLAPEILAPLAERAEHHGVLLLQEVQGGIRPDGESFQRQLAAIDRIGSRQLGFVFDLSACMPALPVSYLEALRQEGVPRCAVDYLEAEWHGSTPQSLKAGLDAALGDAQLTGAARARLSMVFGRFGNTTVAEWREFLPLVRGVHLKYWDLEDRDGRVSGPIGELRRELAAAGYAGAVTSEWGGHEWLDIDPIGMARGHRRLYDKSPT
ncbi:hypothetical protein ACHMXB_16685 [Arthrobacter sp. UC242_113]|uniref:hypothetical protein n=1 Tax=Arthrobacter sp. UC242_113 TaxID=3374550 RepID=UPI0037580E20